jgi:ABC-type amino acid transport substrate-binding protein
MILASASAHSVELRTAAQPNTPKFYRDNGTLTGISYDIIQAIQRADPTLRFSGYEQELPTKRIEKMLEQGQLDVYVGFLVTPARQHSFDFIDVPLFSPRIRLLSRKDDQLTIQSLDELPPLGNDGIVLTTRGTPLPEQLQQLQPGLLIDAGTDSNDLNVRKLLQKRGRVFCQFDFVLAHALRRQHRLPQQYRPIAEAHSHPYIAAV